MTSEDQLEGLEALEGQQATLAWRILSSWLPRRFQELYNRTTKDPNVGPS